MANKPVILAVDDEASNLQLVEALLTPLGYEVVVWVTAWMLWKRFKTKM